MSKKSSFRIPFDKQHSKLSQTNIVEICPRESLPYDWLLCTKLNWKKPLLVICKILGLFGNTLTADEKYSLLNNDNLTQPIQMKLSKKQKNFLIFFSVFLKSSSHFQHFLNNDSHQSLCISEIIECKRRG